MNNFKKNWKRYLIYFVSIILIIGVLSSNSTSSTPQSNKNTSIKVASKNYKNRISQQITPTYLPTPTPCSTLDGDLNQVLYHSCDSPTPAPTLTPNLELTDESMDSSTYSSPYPIFSAELHNNNYLNYSNVVVKFSFYKQSAASCLLPADDNEYVKVADIIMAGDTKTLRIPIQTSFDTYGAFTWCAYLYRSQPDFRNPRW